MSKKSDKKLDEEFNMIYQDLVENEYDLTGMIAYSFYKYEKIKFIEKIKKEKGKVTKEDIHNYHVSSQVRVEDYKEKAINALTEFVDDVVDEKVRMNADLIEKLIEKKAGPKGFINWARSITQSIIAAIIYSVIVIVILFIVWFSSSGNRKEAESKISDTAKGILHITPVDSTSNDSTSTALTK